MMQMRWWMALCLWLIPAWNAGADALEPLRTAPVQMNGMVRCLEAFARETVETVTGDVENEEKDALRLVLEWMARPESRSQEAWIKTSHPALGRLFQGKRVSLKDFRDPEKAETLQKLIRHEPQLLRPLHEMEKRARLLEDLPEKLALFPPRKKSLVGSSAWQGPANLLKRQESDSLSPQEAEALKRWEALMAAIRWDKEEALADAAAALAEFSREMAEQEKIEPGRLKADLWFTRNQPFWISALFCLAASLAYLAAALWGSRKPAWLGLALLLIAFGWQITGLYFRGFIGQQAPLGNLYESVLAALSVALIAAALLEIRWRFPWLGWGAGLMGFVLLVITHNSPFFDNDIRPFVPALQSSWLTFHVAAIMASYGAFLLSFFVSLLYLAKEALGGDHSHFRLVRQMPSLAYLDFFNYKILILGFPLLTLGIVFGAVWAATAWGRPWGWDPKETWSAITWLVYAVWLHARLMVGWKGRRTAWLSIAGFLCVLFTWFGVNLFLQGLHSYV